MYKVNFDNDSGGSPTIIKNKEYSIGISEAREYYVKVDGIYHYVEDVDLGLVKDPFAQLTLMLIENHQDNNWFEYSTYDLLYTSGGAPSYRGSHLKKYLIGDVPVYTDRLDSRVIVGLKDGGILPFIFEFNDKGEALSYRENPNFTNPKISYIPNLVFASHTVKFEDFELGQKFRKDIEALVDLFELM